MQQKLKEWVDIYLNHIEKVTPAWHVEHEEGYKFKTVNTFQQSFDLEAEDLAEMLDRAIYPNNLSMGAMYFPRKMLLHFAADLREETRSALRNLFDGSVPVVDRITATVQTFEEIGARYADSHGYDKKASFIGLRFITLLLGLYAPELYNPIKPREWKVFARFIDPAFHMPNHTPPGEQYEIFGRYIEPLREYIRQIPRVQFLKEDLTSGLQFNDSEFRWMAQDVIYIASKEFATIKGGEAGGETGHKEAAPEPLEPLEASIGSGMEFPLELYLEHFMVQNWDSIDFGEELEFYVDPDGTEGRQYVTDVGIIDILARDREGNFVVLELKRGRGHSAVVGQILSYMNWVDNNLSENGRKSRGIIIVSGAHPALISAREAVADRVDIKYYDVKLSLKD